MENVEGKRRTLNIRCLTHLCTDDTTVIKLESLRSINAELDGAIEEAVSHFDFKGKKVGSMAHNLNSTIISVLAVVQGLGAMPAKQICSR